ncbi:S8 family serine peptidase [Enterococcus faecalis]|jgi:subtilisin family serine protease
MRKFNIQKIVFSLSLLLFSIFFFKLSEVQAQTNSLDVLVSDTNEINQLKEEVSKLTNNLEFIEIPEINLLRIENPSDKVRKTIENTEEVEFYGKIADNVGLENTDLQVKQVKTAINFKYMTEKNTIEKDLLNKLNWYVDSLTINKKSLDYSKGEGVKIGLIDSGVDLKHPLIKKSLNLNKAKSFVNQDQAIEDTNGHGTMVAGVISQIAPKAQLTPYRVMSSIDGESLWTLQAMVQAINDKQDILNMSLGTYKSENINDEKLTIEAFKRAIQFAKEKNVLIVSSSGNQQIDLDTNYNQNKILHLPGDLEGVVTVSAINKDNSLADYSNTGSMIQFTAPGGEVVIDENGALDARELIYTSYPLGLPNLYKEAGIPDGYTLTYGTSFSAAGISAVFADYYSYYLTNSGGKPLPTEASNKIATTSEDLGLLGKDSQYGYGLPNLLRAYGSSSTN